jgi:hypothetical protein
MRIVSILRKISFIAKSTLERVENPKVSFAINIPKLCYTGPSRCLKIIGNLSRIPHIIKNVFGSPYNTTSVDKKSQIPVFIRWFDRHLSSEVRNHIFLIYLHNYPTKGCFPNLLKAASMNICLDINLLSLEIIWSFFLHIPKLGKFNLQLFQLLLEGSRETRKAQWIANLKLISCQNLGDTYFYIAVG